MSWTKTAHTKVYRWKYSRPQLYAEYYSQPRSPESERVFLREEHTNTRWTVLKTYIVTQHRLNRLYLGIDTYIHMYIYVHIYFFNIYPCNNKRKKGTITLKKSKEGHMEGLGGREREERKRNRRERWCKFIIISKIKKRLPLKSKLTIDQPANKWRRQINKTSILRLTVEGWKNILHINKTKKRESGNST